MVKQSNIQYLYVVGSLLLIFAIYFWFINEVPVFKVEVISIDEETIHEQQVSLNTGVATLQSVFGTKIKLDEFLMQSTVPLDKTANLAVLESVVENTFQEKVQLMSVEYYKNDEFLDVRAFTDFFLEPGNMFTYTSEPINVEGRESQRNEIMLRFEFETTKGTKHIDYVYEYLQVTRCVVDLDCPQIAPMCDKANAARFSRSKNTYYCVRPCGAHNDCAPGQICIMGACGY